MNNSAIKFTYTNQLITYIATAQNTSKETIQESRIKERESLLNFNIWSLTRADLSKVKNHWKHFQSLTKQEDVTSFALALCLKCSDAIPTRYPTAYDFMQCVLSHNDNISVKNEVDMIKWLEKVTQVKKEKAVNFITLSNAKHRHNYQQLQNLEGLSDLKNGVHILSASHGTGKTKLVGIPFIEKENEYAIAMCHLRSLTSDIASRFNIAHYEELRDEIKALAYATNSSIESILDLNIKKKIAICLNSIVKTLESQVKKTNTILIDEISQVLSVVASANYKDFDHIAIYERLISVIKNADRVLVLDADLDDSVIDFLEVARPNEIFKIYELERKNEGHKIEWVYGTHEKITASDTAVERLLAMLHDDKKVILATDSQKKAEQIQSLLEKSTSSKVLNINSKTTNTKAVQAFFNNPDSESKKYDLVIHSPTLRSGVSIENNHFDVGIGLFIGKSIASQDAIQMLRRARNLKEWLICVEPSFNDAIDSQSDLTQSQLIIDADERNATLSLDNLTSFDLFRNAQLAKENGCKNMFAQALYFQLQAYKFQITHCKSRARAATSLSQIAKHQKDKYQSLIVNSPLLTNDEYELLRARIEKTTENMATIEAHKIRDFFKVDDLTIEHVAFWDEGHCKNKIEMYEAVISDNSINDDTGSLSLSLRAFKNVKLKAYKEILSLTDLDLKNQTGQITNQQEQAILEHCWKNKFTYSYLNIIPSKFRRDQTNKPADLKKFIKPILSKIGIELKTKESSIRNNKSNPLKIRVLTFNNDKIRLVETRSTNENCMALSTINIKKNARTAIQSVHKKTVQFNEGLDIENDIQIAGIEIESKMTLDNMSIYEEYSKLMNQEEQKAVLSGRR